MAHTFISTEFYFLCQILTVLETEENETLPREGSIAHRKNMLRAYQLCGSLKM
jgi:hypothetical protein